MKQFYTNPRINVPGVSECSAAPYKVASQVKLYISERFYRNQCVSKLTFSYSTIYFRVTTNHRRVQYKSI